LGHNISYIFCGSNYGCFLGFDLLESDAK